MVKIELITAIGAIDTNERKYIILFYQIYN